MKITSIAWSVGLVGLMAGTACAQSSVTLSGVIKTGVAQTRLSQGEQGNGSATTLSDGASRFVLSGREDLGDRWYAVFQVDTRFRSDETPEAAQAGGETFVGLTSPWGVLRVGKFDTHYCLGRDEHEMRATARQASNCGVLGYVQQTPIANASRATNAIRYDLPHWAGLDAQLTYSTAWHGSEGMHTSGKGYAGSGQLSYTWGPLYVAGSAWKGESENRTLGAAVADQSAQTLATRLNWGPASVGLTYDISKITTASIGQNDALDVERRAWSVPMTLQWGAGTVLLTYTKAENMKLGGQTMQDSGATLWSLGYDHAFSKRTSLGISYAELNNQAGASYSLFTLRSLGSLVARPLPGQDVRQLYVGLRHAF